MAEERKRRRPKGESEPEMVLPAEHTPPQELDMERMILGSILLNSDVLNDIADIIKATDFYLEQHQILYRELEEMYNASRQIDEAIFLNHLRENDKLNLIGGVEYLAEIIHSVPHTAHVKTYAQIVRDKARLRQLIYASSSILQEAYQPEVDINALVSRAEEKIFAVHDERSNDSVADIHQVLNSAWEKIQMLTKQGGSLGISTGFADLDAMTGGLHKKELVILAARPSMGKTALATNIADAVAIGQDKGVLFVSLEMAKEELAMRMLCGRAMVDGQRVRQGYLSNSDKEKMLAASSVMMNKPFVIDDSASRTVSEIAAIARRQKRRWENEGKELALIVIDYLQLIKEDDSRDPRQEQVAKIARRLKGLARELDVPVMCLSQLNRQTEQGTDNRPKLSQLRESGAIEQDADVVMFVHREAYYKTKKKEAASEKGKAPVDNTKDAEIIIAKQRNGPTGVVQLVWEAKYTKFVNRVKISPSSEFSSDFDDFSN